MKILDKPFEIQKEMDRIRKEIEVRESKLGDVSISFEEIKSKSNVSLLEIKILEVINLKERLKALEEECVDIAKSIMILLDCIDSLSDIERRVIFFKKVHLFSFREIAYIESYSKSKICEIFKCGIEKIKKKDSKSRNERSGHLKPCQ